MNNLSSSRVYDSIFILLFNLILFIFYIVGDFFFFFFAYQEFRVRVMLFNATFNNISVISWRSVLFVEETGVLVDNHQPAASQ